MKLFNLKSIQFGQIFADIDSYLAGSQGPVKSINKNTVFGQLMTVLAGLVHNVMLYIEDAFVEQNKYSAQRKKSILGLAAQTGYKPSYGMAAGVWVRIAPLPQTNPTEGDLVIPKYQKIVCSSNSLYYNLMPETSKIVLGTAHKDVYAVQGRFEKQSFMVPEGRALYAQNFKFVGFIDERYIEVKVNGTTWEPRASLYDMAPGTQTFTIRYNPTSGIDILFGDGLRGKLIETGDRIDISYLLHDGEAGNIDPNKSNIFAFDGRMYDSNGTEVDGNTRTRMSLTSQEAVVAGSNPESLEHIREMIGFNTRSLVLSDANAYKAWLSRFSFVGYNRTWSEPGQLIIRSLVMRNFRQDIKTGGDYFDLDPKQFVLTDTQKDALKNSIVQSGCQLIGSTYDILDVELRRYALFVHARLKPDTAGGDADKAVIANQIREALGDFFVSPQSDMYIPKSDIIDVIKSKVSVVDGVDVYFLSEANETARRNRSYVENGQNVLLREDENPRIGLDEHGNILLEDDRYFPVIMGGWQFRTGTDSQGHDVLAEARGLNITIS